MIGVAAHICAAASGAGARRYDAEMSPEQRSDISNGIWLCSSCSVLIDRDEQRFTVEALHKIKRDHEQSRRIGGPSASDEGDVIAIGPEIIALGHIIRSGPDGIRVRISHFVSGSSRDLWSMTQDFAKWPPERRYVLFNELGFGGMLAGPPIIERAERAYEVQFVLQEPAPRRDATASIKTMDRNLGRMLEGMEAYVQIFEGVLGMAHGSWFADTRNGTDLSDLYWRYNGSPWFERLAMMELIRLASIPRVRRGSDEPTTSLLSVNRVNRVRVPSFEFNDQRLAVEVEFELEGMGRWEHTLQVFISTPEQLIQSRETAQQMSRQISDIENEYRRRDQ